MLKGVRSRLVDANIKIAIENHAGDMQARELKSLVEGAGPDVVGVCLDSGNPVWTIEDPHLTLDTLAPYVLTSHMRDSALWRTPEGIAVRWTRMGEGNIGMEDYIRKYIKMCPGKAVSLEVIVTGQPRMFNYAVRSSGTCIATSRPGSSRDSWRWPTRARRSSSRRRTPRPHRRSATWPTSRRASAGRRPSWPRFDRGPDPLFHQADRDIVQLRDNAADITVSVMTSVSNAYEIVVRGQNVVRVPFVTGYNCWPAATAATPFLPPFANRLDEQAFYANGKKYNFDMELGNVRGAIPIHGYLSAAKDWKMAEAACDGTGAWVTSSLDFYRNPQWMRATPIRAHAAA